MEAAGWLICPNEGREKVVAEQAQACGPGAQAD